jgi:hypothetical protein
VVPVRIGGAFAASSAAAAAAGRCDVDAHGRSVEVELLVRHVQPKVARKGEHEPQLVFSRAEVAQLLHGRARAATHVNMKVVAALAA